MLRADQVTTAQPDARESAACVGLSRRRGTLAVQVTRHAVRSSSAANPRAAMSVVGGGWCSHAELEFYNGFGGFDAKMREYVTVLHGRPWTPTPWINERGQTLLDPLRRTPHCPHVDSNSAQEIRHHHA